MLLPHLTDRHLCEHTACFISKHSMNILNPPLWTSPPLLAMLLVFSRRIAILAFCSSFSGVNTSPPYKSAADSVSLKPQITNPPTLKAFSFQACIFLACEGVSAITLSFHGTVSKPVSVYHEYLPKREWTSPLLAAPVFGAFLPSLPTILCSLYAPSHRPLYMWCLFFKSSFTAVLTSACSSCCQTMQSQPRTQTFFASVKASHCWSFANFQKAGWPMTQVSNLSLSPTLFPYLLDFCGLEKKESACFYYFFFFLFTPFKISGITSLPF